MEAAKDVYKKQLNRDVKATILEQHLNPNG